MIDAHSSEVSQFSVWPTWFSRPAINRFRKLSTKLYAVSLEIELQAVWTRCWLGNVLFRLLLIDGFLNESFYFLKELCGPSPRRHLRSISSSQVFYYLTGLIRNFTCQLPHTAYIRVITLIRSPIFSTISLYVILLPTSSMIDGFYGFFLNLWEVYSEYYSEATYFLYGKTDLQDFLFDRFSSMYIHVCVCC